MKDSLFQMLLNLFEKSMNQDLTNLVKNSSVEIEESLASDPIIIKQANPSSTRVIAEFEYCKMTKASLQFLYRMLEVKLIDKKNLEVILQQIEDSESSLVSLEEVKWIIRENLSTDLEPAQLAYMDRIIYPEDKAHVIH